MLSSRDVIHCCLSWVGEEHKQYCKHLRHDAQAFGNVAAYQNAKRKVADNRESPFYRALSHFPTGVLITERAATAIDKALADEGYAKELSFLNSEVQLITAPDASTMTVQNMKLQIPGVARWLTINEKVGVSKIERDTCIRLLSCCKATTLHCHGLLFR